MLDNEAGGGSSSGRPRAVGNASGGGPDMSTDLYTEYNAAIGELISARKQYTDACESQGTDSWAAEQAQEYVSREVAHLNEVRERYDSAALKRSPDNRDV